MAGAVAGGDDNVAGGGGGSPSWGVNRTLVGGGAGGCDVVAASSAVEFALDEDNLCCLIVFASNFARSVRAVVVCMSWFGTRGQFAHQLSAGMEMEEMMGRRGG